MKPMGTITKYYPFIDEESKTTLDSLMEESSSYYDFVQRICEVVLNNKVPVNLTYIAAVQAWWCRLKEHMNQIQEKYKDVPCIRPWGHAHASVESDQIRFHDSVVTAIESLMQESVDDWILTELHLLHAHYHWPMFGDIPSLLEPVEKARELMAANPLLRCFEAQAYAYDGWSKRVEGDIDSSVATYKRGLELAESHDESLHRYLNLGGLGDVLKNVSIKEAAARFEESYSVVQDLEVPYLEGEVLHDSGLVFEVAGEYDLAMATHLEALKTLEFNESENYQSLALTRVYILMGNSERALEMVDRYSKYVEPIETIIVQFLKAWALALTDKLGDAERILETAYSMIIKSGFEQLLGDYYHISGVIELRKGNFLDAIESIEKAWKIAERMPSGLNKNRALLDLARVEILLSGQSKDSTKIVTPGKWLCKLITYAEERELHGISMQAALLKSEFYQIHDQSKDAQAVLRYALNITDSLGVVTLRKKIKERIQELDQLVKDEELVS
ncbi:MAG: hypothetical protein ACTSSE_18130 [Candidatus Thorarchaeota archaeon]